MAQNRKKGMAKRALSVSLVAAMLATSNTPAWASGFVNENEDGVQAFLNEISNAPVSNANGVLEAAATVTVTHSDLTSALDACNWVDVNEKMAALVEAGKKATFDEGTETNIKVIGAVAGTISGSSEAASGKLPEGARFTPWSKNLAPNRKELVGEKLAVGLKLHEGDSDEDYYYVTASSAKIEKLTISSQMSTNPIVSWEAAVNGEKITGTPADFNKTVYDLGEEIDLTALSFTFRNGVSVSLNETDIAEEMDISEGKTSSGQNYVSLAFRATNPYFANENAIQILVKKSNGTMQGAYGLKLKDTKVTYHYTGSGFETAIKALLNPGTASTENYNISFAKDSAGLQSVALGTNPVDAGTELYMVVSGTDSTGLTPWVSPKITVVPKDLETLQFEPNALQDWIDGITWKPNMNLTMAGATGGTLLSQVACMQWEENSAAVKLNTIKDLKIEFSNVKPKAGEKVTVKIIPANTANTNYVAGKVKSFQFTPKLDVSTDLKTNLGTAISDLGTITYRPAGYTVNDLFKKPIGNFLRGQYTVTTEDGRNNVTDTGKYALKITVTDANSPFYGHSAVFGETESGAFEIKPADLKMFQNGGDARSEVKANPIVWEAGLKDLSDSEKYDLIGMELFYDGVKLGADDYEFEGTITGGSNFAAGEAVTVKIKPGKSGNYEVSGGETDVDVNVGKVQTRALPELPAIPTQAYAGKLTSLAQILVTDAFGDSVSYDKILKDGDYKLVQSQDYTVKFSATPADGNGNVTLTFLGLGNYAGSKQTVTFAVTKEQINGTFLYKKPGTQGVAALPSQPYSYAAAKAGITLNALLDDDSKATTAAGSGIDGKVNDGEVYVLGTDGKVVDKSKYTVTYKDNKAAGTATIEANGINGYALYAVSTFEITPKQISTGSDVKVSDATGANSDYTAIKELTAVFAGGTGDGKDEYAYTGSEIAPKVTLKAKSGDGSSSYDSNSVFLHDGAYTLVEGKDYQVTFKNNVNAAKSSAKKAPTVVITGMGNYVFNERAVTHTKDNTGAELKFQINPVNLTKANVSAKDVEYAGGLTVTPDLTVISPVTGKTLELGKDYAVDLTNGVNVGVAEATIKAVAGNGNFTFDWDDSSQVNKNITVAFQITKKPLSKCDAKVVEGKVVLTCNGITVPETEYTATENEDGSFTVKAAEKNYTGTITIAPFAAPAATQAKVTAKTTSSVTVSWDAVEGAEGYTIWYHSEKDTKNARKVITGGDITSWTHKGLAAGTKYFYTVKAWVKDAEGKYVFGEETSYVRGTTMPMKAKIAKVTAANGMIKVALADAAAGAEKYSMCYSKSSDFASFKVGVRTSYTTRTFTNALTKGTYYVRVKSYRDLGNNKRIYGAWSNTVKVVVK